MRWRESDVQVLLPQTISPQKRKGDFSCELSPSLPIFRRSGSASKPQLRYRESFETCGLAPVFPALFRGHSVVRALSVSSESLRFPGCSVSPVAGPRDFPFYSLPLEDLSSVVLNVLAIRINSSGCYKFSGVEIACFL